MEITDIQKVKAFLEKKPNKKPAPNIEERIKETEQLEAKNIKVKRLTKKELAEQELQQMINYQPSLTNECSEETVVEKTKKQKEWDVPLDEPVEFFDPELSYELTGYRPITATKGLDFDPKLFTEAADAFRKNGRYTDLIPDTFAHRQHWLREFQRCRDGVTIGKYTLTGENYFFLNYFRLPSVLDKSGAELQEENFPGFLAKQYEYFHYLELCRKSGHDGMAFKSRGVGASQIAASNCACAYTFHKATRNIVTAFSDNYVDDTLSKVWQELDFLNTQTEGAFRRLRMKIDTNRKKKASKVDQDKNETGWGSIVEGITADEPRKLRGARVYNLFFEEAGSNPVLIPTYIQSRALVVINGYRVGTRTVFGTAGDKGPNLAGLKDMFYNPTDYLILPYKHNYTQTKDYIFSGYFIPSYTMWFGTPTKPGFDSRGVVDEERAKAYYEVTWNKIKDPKKLIQDKAEYCFTPEDAFILEGQNQFDQDKLTDQLAALTVHKIVEKPKSIKLHWKLNGDGAVDRNQRPTVEYVTDGPLQITELPMTNDQGIPYTNLYLAGVDAVDLDSSTSTGQTDVSNFCMIVMRRQLGTMPPKVVAIYKERPKHIQTAFDTALKLCMFYNCKMLVEATRISIKQYFEKEHKLDFLLRRPKATANTWGKTNFKQFGVPATEPIIRHQLDLIEQYIVDYCEEIQFPDLLDELIRYSYENKRKFDVVAAFGLTLLADEDYIGKLARVQNTSTKCLTFGYYKNDQGQISITSYDNTSKPRAPSEAPFKLFV